jgi:hypothetical protein
MSQPFKIIKKSGHEDRFIFEGNQIDDFLTAQVLRDYYFTLSGQEKRIGQTHCKEFTRKDSLINECKRLIKHYIANPDEWDEILDRREKREKREKKKAEALAARKILINKKIKELSKLTYEEFEILEIAMAFASPNITGKAFDSDSEYESD